MKSKCVDSDKKLQNAQISCILLLKTHLFYEEYDLKRQGSFSSNSVWHVTTHNVRNGKRMLGICQCPEENYSKEVNFDYFRLINRKCVSDYSDDRLLFFVRLPITI